MRAHRRREKQRKQGKDSHEGIYVATGKKVSVFRPRCSAREHPLPVVMHPHRRGFTRIETPFSNLERCWHSTRFFLPAVAALILSALYTHRPGSVSHPFSAPFSWALLQVNSCVRQLRVFCFPGSALNTIGLPPIKQPLALEAEALAFLCPKKMGQKKEKIQSCLTYMLGGIGFRAGSLADG
jgi:hypothetical protein